MTPEQQDQMAEAILYKKRHFYDFLNGRLPPAEFQTELSQEWRSLPSAPDNFAYAPKGEPRVRARIDSVSLQNALSAVLKSQADVQRQLDDGQSPPP